METEFLGAPECQLSKPVYLIPSNTGGQPLAFPNYPPFMGRLFLESVKSFGTDTDNFTRRTGELSSGSETALTNRDREVLVALNQRQGNFTIKLGSQSNYLNAALVYYFAELIGGNAVTLADASARSLNAMEHRLLCSFLFESGRYYHGHVTTAQLFHVNTGNREPVLFFDNKKPHLPLDAQSRADDPYITLIVQRLDAIRANKRFVPRNPIQQAGRFIKQQLLRTGLH